MGLATAAERKPAVTQRAFALSSGSRSSVNDRSDRLRRSRPAADTNSRASLINPRASSPHTQSREPQRSGNRRDPQHLSKLPQRHSLPRSSPPSHFSPAIPALHRRLLRDQRPVAALHPHSNCITVQPNCPACPARPEMSRKVSECLAFFMSRPRRSYPSRRDRRAISWPRSPSLALAQSICDSSGLYGVPFFISQHLGACSQELPDEQVRHPDEEILV